MTIDDAICEIGKLLQNAHELNDEKYIDLFSTVWNALIVLGELQEDMNMLRTLNAIDLDGEEDE